MFDFKIKEKDTHGAARIGTFSTPHGTFETPCFMPCGTKGAVKTLTPDELKTIGIEVVLGNTYHLMLRPGSELIAKMGGLHKWMGWDRPMLTDSGGFQVFSLSKLRKIDDNGATFQSHIDGSTHVLTPERSIQIQEELGADIIMAFDECPPGDADEATARSAMERTHAWLKRCIAAKKREDQALFPIVQGGTYAELRKESAKFVTQFDLPGTAIGGVAVGETKEKIYEVLDVVTPLLPLNKPRYLMGVGEPVDIVEAVGRGIDMFDCVAPTRIARHGNFWTATGRHSIDNSRFREDEHPLDKACSCYTCTHFSASYLRHLMIEKEILGHRLLTIHNLHFLVELTRQCKKAIQENGYASFARSFINNFTATDA